MSVTVYNISYVLSLINCDEFVMVCFHRCSVIGKWPSIIDLQGSLLEMFISLVLVEHCSAIKLWVRTFDISS